MSTVTSSNTESKNKNTNISNEANLSFLHSSNPAHDTGAGFYNKKMTLGRDLAVLAAVAQQSFLNASLSSCSCQKKSSLSKQRPYRLLDAFSGVGALALRLSKALDVSTTQITANDRSPTCFNLIAQNIASNNITNVIAANQDVNVNLTIDAVNPEQRPYDFIHLDPFGCVVPYLDCAFRDLPGGSILSFTSTDVTALYDRRYKNVAKRHYTCELHEPRDPNTYRETAVRMILSAVASSAGRNGKGIQVLLSCAVEHFILIQVRVVRGSVGADNSMKCVNLMKVGIQGRQAVCSSGSTSSDVTVTEGPLWTGRLGCSQWCNQLLDIAKSTELGCSKKKIMKLLNTLSKEMAEDMQEAYYFTRVQSIVKELHLDAEPRRDDVIQELLKMGVNACSTHFDPHSIKMAENRTFLVDAVKNVRSRSIQKKALLSHSIGTR